MASIQPFEPSVRPVFFETGVEEFFYATHGGTLFLVEYLGKPYAITCDHVFKDFEPGRLVVGQDQVPKGCKAANVKGRYRPVRIWRKWRWLSVPIHPSVSHSAH